MCLERHEGTVPVYYSNILLQNCIIVHSFRGLVDGMNGPIISLLIRPLPTVDLPLVVASESDQDQQHRQATHSRLCSNLITLIFF